LGNEFPERQCGLFQASEPPEIHLASKTVSLSWQSGSSSKSASLANVRPCVQIPIWKKKSQFDKSVQTKKINATLHDAVCQHCKEVLEWCVKYSKYKPLSQPEKCVKCLKKIVKDSYHIIRRSRSYELEVCTKCGEKEDIVFRLIKKQKWQKMLKMIKVPTVEEDAK
jgi:hypothetical protein